VAESFCGKERLHHHRVDAFTSESSLGTSCARCLPLDENVGTEGCIKIPPCPPPPGWNRNQKKIATLDVANINSVIGFVNSQYAKREKKEVNGWILVTGRRRFVRGPNPANSRSFNESAVDEVPDPGLPACFPGGMK
jgi:hypothetical protein